MIELFKAPATWAVIISILSAVAGYFGLQFTAEDQQILVGGAAGAFSSISMIVAVIVRRKNAPAATPVSPESGHVLADVMVWLTFITVGAVLVAGLLVAQTAFAADATLNWNAPQTREDGSALQPGEIKGYEICAKTGAAFTDDTDCPRSILVDGSATSYVVRNGLPDDGTPAHFRVLTLDQEALASSWSNVVEKKAASRPKAPVLQ